MRLPLFKAVSGLMVKWFGCLALAYFVTASVFPMDPANKMDYNGDGLTDLGVFREASRDTFGYEDSYFYVLLSPNDVFFSGSGHWGRKLDIPIPSDYDGDHKTDLAVYRWFEPFALAPDINASLLQYSSDQSFNQRYFGHVTGRKCSRDFTGDGHADVAELRRENIGSVDAPSFTNSFYVEVTGGLNVKTTGGNTAHQVPVPEDYMAETPRTYQSEIAVYDTLTHCYKVWANMNNNADGVETCLENLSGPSVPAPGDYDGDGLADFAVVQSNYTTDKLVWTIRYNKLPVSVDTIEFGHAADIPVPGFYDNTIKTNLAVVHAIGTPQSQENWQWEIKKSTCTPCDPKIVVWGLKKDIVLNRPYFYDSWY